MSNWLSKPFQWANKQLFGSGPPDTYGGQIDAAGKTAQSYGDKATATYFDQATHFDPQASLRESVGGLYDQFEQDTGRKIDKMRGDEVGAGRLGGGYGAQDEDAAIYDSRRQLNDTVASMAMQSEGLKVQNMRDIGQFGEQENNNYLSILGGQQDAETARYNAKQAQRGQFWSAIAELGGDALGHFLPSSGGGGGGTTPPKATPPRPTGGY